MVIAKLRWFVVSNRISDRQWNDILRVLESQWESFDFDYTRRWCAFFGLLPDLEKVLAEAKP